MCLCWLLPVRLLLPDEILDLRVLHSGGLWEAIATIPQNAGAVPLSYLARWGILRLLGESSFSVRLPSALCSLAACPGIYLLARRFGLSRPLLAVGLFMIFPLELRYAVEARAYAQAQCLGVWATVLFLRWSDRPGAAGRAGLYGLAVVAGIYTHPYSLFVAAAHLAWLCLERPANAQAQRMRAPTAGVILLAILVFVPWYEYGSRIWSEGVAAIYPQSSVGWRAGLLILHEISGAGYFGAALMTGGIALGLRSSLPGRPSRLFWVLSLATPIAGALAADIVFVYFLAIRQVLFVLVPASVLMAAGAEHRLLQRHAALRALLLAVVAGTLLYADARLFRLPGEDWQSAARILAQSAGPRGCVWFAPESSELLYAYFQPELSQKACTFGRLSTGDAVALAVSASGEGKAAEDRRQLQERKWIKVADLNPATPRIELYRRANTQ